MEQKPLDNPAPEKNVPSVDPMDIRGNKRIINGWAMYDWANSVYSLTITTAIFPIYYLAITSADDGGSQPISAFGFSLDNVALYSFAVSASFLIAMVIAPLLSGIADYTGKKKGFMMFFCYLGALSCSSLYFFTGPENLELGLVAFVLAGIGFTGSIVFYNAYLPEIAHPKDQDRVSSKGYALGYIGSVILLIINLVVISFPDMFFDVPGKAASRRHPFLKGELVSAQRN